MKKHYRRNSLNSDLMGLTGTGLTIGMGSMVATSLNAPAGVKEGFTTAAGFMPLMSAGVMSKHLLKQIKKVK